jgi:hypothetical protein
MANLEALAVEIEQEVHGKPAVLTSESVIEYFRSLSSAASASSWCAALS